MKKFLGIALSVILAVGAISLGVKGQNFPGAAGNPSILSRPGGMFYAPAFFWTGRVISGNTSTSGSQTVIFTGTSGGTGGVTVADGTVVPLQTVFNTLTPMIFDWGQGAAETVTPTSVSVSTCPAGNLGVGGVTTCVYFTGTFTNTHGQSAVVVDGTYGLQTALNYAYTLGGGQALVDTAWAQMGGTSTLINTAVPWPFTSVVDTRLGVARNWNPTPTGAALAAPTLPAINIAGQAACDATHQMCSDATVAGSASWGSTVYACWAYVDIFGNEGPCSATTSWTSVASKAIDLGIPAASTGAVGAVPYLSLSGGTYILAYQIPVTSTVCTMTKLETITPACAVANTTYGQSGSTYGAGGLFTTGGAQITTYPVNTAELATVLATTANTLTGQHTFTNSSVSYTYAPGSRTGACGSSSLNIVQQNAAGGINGSSATTVPNPIASWTIPANCFNYIGAEFRISGKWTYTDGGDSSTRIIVAWDANGTNTASVPTPLCNMLDTATGTSAAYNGTYTCTVRILTTGATGTAVVNGYSTQNLAAGATTLVRNTADIAVAASGSIALNTNARITVWFEGVGATNNPGAQGLDGTLEILN